MPYLDPVYFTGLGFWTATGSIALLFAHAWMPTMYRSNWYSKLNKPWFYPPADWIFGVAWFFFYHAMGVATFFAWRENLEISGTGSLVSVENADFWLYYGAIGLYLAHLVPLAFWGLIFFGLRRLSLSLFVIAFTWVCAVLILIAYFFINTTAGFIFLPYVIWLTYATALNAGVYFLNDFQSNLEKWAQAKADSALIPLQQQQQQYSEGNYAHQQQPQKKKKKSSSKYSSDMNQMELGQAQAQAQFGYNNSQEEDITQPEEYYEVPDEEEDYE